MRRLLPILILSSLAFSSKASNTEIFENVIFIKNYDGDTITVDIPGLPFIFGKNLSVRIAGIDTPEIRGKTICESQMAQRAKEETQRLLQHANKVDLISPIRGKYFRIVADVRVDGVSLTETLLKMRFGYSYDGQDKSKIDWCSFIK